MRRVGRRAPALGVLVIIGLGMVPGFAAHPAAAQSGSMNFGVLDPRVSYGIPSYNTQGVQLADLNMLFSTDASCVRTDVGYASCAVALQPSRV